MGHLTVIKSCGIKPLQPEPVKLINSPVFPASQRERETQTCVIKFEIILRSNMQINLSAIYIKTKKKLRDCLPHYLFASPPQLTGIAYLKKGGRGILHEIFKVDLHAIVKAQR